MLGGYITHFKSKKHAKDIYGNFYHTPLNYFIREEWEAIALRENDAIHELPASVNDLFGHAWGQPVFYQPSP